ncbi:MAG TPA: FeS assembly SUF system protein [Bacteroidetes bacterium]|nr:FeS assembly SUF system protein [Bacteroidota bacterium]
MSEENKISSTVAEVSRDEVIKQIKTCYDPEIPVDVWELGLIYELTVVMNNVYVRMTLTSPSCPAAGTLPGDVENKIKSIPGVKDVTVELVWDPPYNTSMMSEEAKLELGFM